MAQEVNEFIQGDGDGGFEDEEAEDREHKTKVRDLAEMQHSVKTRHQKRNEERTDASTTDGSG